MFKLLLRVFGFGAFNEPRLQEMDVHHSHALASKGQALLVDVREVSEWRSAGLPLNAHPVALSDPALVSKVAAIAESRGDQPVLISCLSGKRAAKAIGLLEQGGVQNLTLVTGGLQAWQAAGLPIVEYSD